MSVEPQLGRQSSWEVKENLRKLSGQVFHVVRDNNIFRYRVDESGKVLHEKYEQAKGLAQKKWRAVVTGDPDKKIRDYMHEIPQVKLWDKLSFTFGVFAIIITEFLALRFPQHFTKFYYFVMSGLVTNRYFQYKEEKSELFLLDFCYFMNLSVMMQTGLFPDCLPWYKANYVLCMGCLMGAIVVWQNSLVFHSLDKLTSCFIHAFPPLTLHLYRWQLIPSNAILLEDTLSLKEALLYPTILYSVWQVGYSLIVDVFLHKYLKDNQHIITSARYLVNDKKNGMNQLVTKITRSCGILHPKEKFCFDEWKTKVIFMVSQLAFTVFTIFYTPILYSNYSISFVYIMCVYLWAVWRGGTYYIEIFSERYKLKFVKAEEYATEEQTEVQFQEAMEDPELFKTIYAALEESSASATNESSSHVTYSKQETMVTRTRTVRQVNSTESLKQE